MPNFTLSEIITIVLIILIVFGPERLPEMARKAGQWVRKARTMATDLRRDFEGELGDVTQPLKDVRSEIAGMKSDVQASLTSLSDDIARAKADVEAEIAETGKELEETLTEEDPDAPADRSAGETDQEVDEKKATELSDGIPDSPTKDG